MSCTGFCNPVTIEDAFRKLEVIARRYPPQSKIADILSLEPGRTLAEDIETITDIPTMTTSTVDGFALKVNQPGTKRKIVGLATAVKPYNAILKQGECVRIVNGGVVPEGADTVVPFEGIYFNAEKLGKQFIEVPKKLTSGENIRKRGSDARAGNVLLKDGHRLDYVSIGLLYALGIKQVEIYERPRVCIMSIENKNGRHKVYENNNHLRLLTLFQSHGFNAIDAGSSSNKMFEMEKNLRVAADFACVIVTIGGGGNILKLAHSLEMTFELQSVSSTPGDFSLAYGNIDEKPVLMCMLSEDFCSSWILANIFILPILRQMEGRENRVNMKWKAKLTCSVPKSNSTKFVQARSGFSNGLLFTTPLTCETLFGANSIIEISENLSSSAGDLVDVIIVEPF